MANMTQFLQKKLLDHALNIASWTMPTNVYLALHTADPGEGGSTANEVSTSGTGYARQSLNGVMIATVLSTGRTTNSSAITFATATADWGNISHVSIHDQAGNMLFYGAMNEVFPVANGQTLTPLSPGQLVIGFD